MKLIHHRLDYAKPWSLPDVYLFTGNPIRNARGGVVMGRGAALQVRDTYPGIDQLIRTHKPVTFTAIPSGNQQYIGWFQVKHHWRDPADLRLIRASADMLANIAAARQHVTFHLNAPGIGNGKLSWADVQPALQTLPDNVLIYL